MQWLFRSIPQFITPKLICKSSELLDFLIEKGAYINSKDEYNWTPLHLSADNGHLSVVVYLVNQKLI